jgi:orotate phosphoribosyltransferase
LRSGAGASDYFDKYLFESDPGLLHQVAAAMAAMVPDGIDALAGLELGGVPLATVLSQLTGLPIRFVRKQAKAYGTGHLAEGGAIDGLRLLVVEDVVTTGGQVIASALALRELGADVSTVLCVIDREAGGPDNLSAQGLRLRALFTTSELPDANGTASRTPGGFRTDA